jgi:predicted NUDIX family phosphoesterase
MDKMDEKILVVDREILFEQESLTFQGVQTNKHILTYLMKKFMHYEEVRRGDAETNEEWKQPIPSVIIKRGDEIFVYKRLKAGGESRLHDQLSITVGGHMNRVNDVRSWGTNLVMNVQRELYEEVSIEGPHKLPTLIGLLNDDSNEVGRVHIGILFMLEIPEGTKVSVRETNKLEGYWLRTKDMNKSGLFEALESWSQIIVNSEVL